MTKTRDRIARVGLVAVGFCIAGATLVPAVVAAAPLSAAVAPLIESTCSFDQLDAAAHVVAPSWAERLDADPARKAQARALFDQPVEERRATVQRFVDANPQAQQRWNTDDPRLDDARLRAIAIANTCHNY